MEINGKYVPEDLLLNIMDFLDDKCVCDMRTTCHKFKSFASKTLFRKYYKTVDIINYLSSELHKPERIKTIASTKKDIMEEIKKVNMEILCSMDKCGDVMHCIEKIKEKAIEFDYDHIIYISLAELYCR
eukprot:gene1786-928_t